MFSCTGEFVIFPIIKSNTIYSVYPSTIAEALNLPRRLLLQLTVEDLLK
jgi:hypothetical protein